MAKARRAIVLALVCACARRPRPEGHVVHDELGREVRLKTFPARRVVSIAPSATELLFALGAGGNVVGVDLYSDYPEAARTLTRVGANLDPSLEKIIALRPDVVVMDTTANRRETADALERLGVPVYGLRVTSLADVDRSISDVGGLVGRREAAATLIGHMHERFDELRRRAQALPPTKTLIVVWSDPLLVVGKRSFTSEIVNVAGGINIAEDAGEGFPKYSLERVIRHAPQVIIVGSHKNEGKGPDPVGYWQRWPDLPAVRDGRVHAVDGDLMFRPGPRLADGAARLFEVLHAGKH